MKQRRLTAQEANRLAIKLQVLRIDLINFALKFSFDGKSTLWGVTVDESTLVRERAILSELVRHKEIYDTFSYRELPKIKTKPGHKKAKGGIVEHYLAEEGTIAFVEVKRNLSGQSVVNFLQNPKTLTRRIKNKQQSSNRKTKQMATKGKAVSKPSVTDDIDNLLEGMDDILEGIEEAVPAFKSGTKLLFNHKGVQKEGKVLKVQQDGKIKVVDEAANVYYITNDDIMLNGETAEATRARVKSDETPAVDAKSKAAKQAALAKSKAAPVKATPAKTAPAKTKAKAGEKTQRELVEEQLQKGVRDYDKIAEKTGVTRVNVGQYAYRWFKADPKRKK